MGTTAEPETTAATSGAAGSQREVPLTGYSDRLSARPGETMHFKVSAGPDCAATVEARLLQSISADCNPAGPGIVERPADQWFSGESFEARHQPFYPGSYAISHDTARLTDSSVLSLQALVWPTLASAAPQVILAWGNVALLIDQQGRAACRVASDSVSSSDTLTLRQWIKLRAVLDRGQSQISINAYTVDGEPLFTHQQTIDGDLLDNAFGQEARLSIAAAMRSGIAIDHFNGKIESPSVDSATEDGSATMLADWDFSREISSTHVHDCSPNALHASLVNFPARAMTGARWRGDEMCWRHAPGDYAAIHFHADDIVDFGWETDFSFTLPQGMPSGVYVMRISSGEHEDAMPFYVCPPKDKSTHRLCVVIPTFTYTVYGNHARPDWTPEWTRRNAKWQAYPWNPAEYPAYGQSTYNFHSDGSGICHASDQRPLFNLRPAYRTFGNAECSGLRHFQADSHLLAWLDAQQIGFDVLTDRELHNEGAQCLAAYDAVMTTSHPEYHTPQSLDAFCDYRDQGGNLMYLGGNGFYWRIALHPENASVLEIRRAEDGIRAWAAEPGEYYQAFDGAYGGLWRRNGRPPQALCGVGFSAQGQFNGSWYRKRTVPDELAWIFDGIDGDVIGDFGFSGGGAAGFELDRADVRLGTPPEAVVLASSEHHGDDFILVPEEMLTHLTTVPGTPPEQLIHADMLWFDTPAGGSVFSVGSITFCGSLPYNNFTNTVSTLLRNVVQHMLGRHD